MSNIDDVQSTYSHTNMQSELHCGAMVRESHCCERMKVECCGINTGGRMEHTEFLGTFAAERYVLGEMSEAEMQEYESHYFDCNSCARELELVLSFVKHAKVVFQLEPDHGGMRP